MPKRLAQVAAYTIEFPDDIAFGTVSRISEQAAVQPSTLVRFAKALGFSGFSELQAVFQQRLRDRPNNYEARLQAFDAHASGRSPAMALIEGLSQAAIDSIGKVPRAGQIGDAGRGGANARRRGNHLPDWPSAVVPDHLIFELRLGTLGIRTVLIGSPNGVDRELLSFAGPRDAALSVSFTPYAPRRSNTRGRSPRRRRRSSPLPIAPFSPLVFNASVWFEIVENDFEGFRSLAATMTLAAALAVAVAEQRRIQRKIELAFRLKLNME
jgi:DNA-binding MurR/RpiR family transcriptional regulator